MLSLMYTAPKQPVSLPLSSSLHVTGFKPLQKEGYNTCAWILETHLIFCQAWQTLTVRDSLLGKQRSNFKSLWCGKSKEILFWET